MRPAKPASCSHSVSSQAEVHPGFMPRGAGGTSGSGLCLDRLIADGDPGDLISLLHRQAAWRGLLSRGCPSSQR